MKETVCAGLDQFVQKTRVFCVMFFGVCCLLAETQAGHWPIKHGIRRFVGKGWRRRLCREDGQGPDLLTHQFHEHGGTGRPSSHVRTDRALAVLCDTS